MSTRSTRIPPATAAILGWIVASCIVTILHPAISRAARVAIGGADGVINVKSSPYGARGNGSGDDYRAIQSAIDAACSSSPPAAQVYIPPGSYKISQPLMVRCSGLQLLGAGRMSTELLAGFAGGPMLVLVPKNYQGVATSPGLFGGGRAIDFPKPTVESYVLDLRSARTMDLNGLKALTVEFTIRFSKFGFDAVIGGGDYSGRNRAVEIFFEGKEKLEAYLTVGGKRHDVSAYGLILRTGVNYHVALVYDGRAVRLYLNGKQIAAERASGTITQKADEGMTLGGTPRGPLAMGLIRGIVGGFSVDSVRISDAARYGSNFAQPGQKFSNDAHTLLLLNAKNNPGIFTIAESRAGEIWLPRMDFAYGVMTFTRIRDLELVAGGASGLLAIQCDLCSYDRLAVRGARIGIQFFNNNYRSVMTRLKVVGGLYAWINYIEDVNSGPVDLTDAHFDGAPIGIYSAGGGIYNRLYVSPSTETVYAINLAGESSETDFTLIQPSVDFEPAGRSPLLAALRLEGVNKITVLSGVIEVYNGRPLVEIDGGDNITFIGTELNSGKREQPQPPELIAIKSPPAAPVLVVNPQIKSAGGVPITRTASAVSVLGGVGGRRVEIGGGYNLRQLAAPEPPVVEAKGRGTLYTYFLVAHDLANNATMPSRGTTVSGGSKPENRVCAKPQVGAYYFDVLRGDVRHKVGTISPFQYMDAGHDYCFTDRVVSPAEYVPPTRNTTGDLSAPVIWNGCAGRVRLVDGVATVLQSCITGGRPTACTDNSSDGAFACSAAPFPGKLVLHGVGAHEVSWFQM